MTRTTRADVFLGVYATPESAARALAGLRAAGFPPSHLDVLTDSPYPEGTFGEEPVRHHLYVFPFVGAACGLVVGMLLTIAVQLAYPLVQGGKPLLSIPPMINVLYESTLLGAILVTVLGIIFESRLPDFSGEPFDPRIADGYFGVLVRHVRDRAEEAERALRDAGALDVVVHERDR